MDDVADAEYDDLSEREVTAAEFYQPDALNLDALADRHTIAGFLAQTDPAITAERIRQWAKRGRIPRHGRDAQGRTLYRISDVLEARHARYKWLDRPIGERCDTLTGRTSLPADG